MTKKMTSSRPYLIRAMYDWIVDNKLTPYIVISAERSDVQVPKEHIDKGRIVLNISPVACQGLHIENDRIIFSARFSGEPTQVSATPAAVLAVYAKENGKGMSFDEEEEGEPPPSIEEPPSDYKRQQKRKPRLTVVK